MKLSAIILFTSFSSVNAQFGFGVLQDLRDAITDRITGGDSSNDGNNGGGGGGNKGNDGDDGGIFKEVCSCNAFGNCRWRSVAAAFAPDNGLGALELEDDGWWIDNVGKPNGKFSFKHDDLTVRYDMDDSVACGGKDKSENDGSLAMAFIEVDVKCPVYLDLRHYGKVNNDSDDVDFINVWVDGKWVFQAASKPEGKGCSMGDPLVTKKFPGKGIKLEPGKHDFAVQIAPNSDKYHKGAFHGLTFKERQP